MRTVLWLVWLTALAVVVIGPAEAVAIDGGYAVVVSKATGDDPQWKPVVDALLDKHQAKMLTYQRSVDESLAGFAASSRGTSASSPSQRRLRGSSSSR